MNPAVTFGLFLLKKVNVIQLVLYILAQCLGAIAGSFLLWGCTSGLTSQCENEYSSPVCSASYDDKTGYGPPVRLFAVLDHCIFPF